MKGILLDLDDTVYDYERSHSAGIDASLQHFSARYDYPHEIAVQKFAIARNDVKAVLHGSSASHNRLLYFKRMLEIEQIFSPSEAMQLNDIYWNDFIENISLSEDTSDFFANAKRNAIPICIVTNFSTDIQFRKIAKLGIEDYIDHVVTSEEVGAEKPDHLIFDFALERIGLPARQVCMIGDDWQNDIVGATTLGIRSYWFNPKAVAAPKDNQIDRFLVRELRHLRNIEL